MYKLWRLISDQNPSDESGLPEPGTWLTAKGFDEAHDWAEESLVVQLDPDRRAHLDDDDETFTVQVSVDGIEWVNVISGFRPMYRNKNWELISILS